MQNSIDPLSIVISECPWFDKDSGTFTEMTLELLLSSDSLSLNISEFIPKITGSCRFILKTMRFDSFEEAADALSSYLFSYPFAKVALCFTGIQANNMTYAYDYRSDLHVEEVKTWGKVKILFENGTYGIYVLTIAPKCLIPLHLHQIMDESELVLTSGLLLQEIPVSEGVAIHWKKNFAHFYENPSDYWQKILCIDSPPFIPEDEVLVPSATYRWPDVESVSTYWG